MCSSIFKINTNQHKKAKRWMRFYQWWERKGNCEGLWGNIRKGWDRLNVCCKYHNEVYLRGDKSLSKKISLLKFIFIPNKILI